MPESRVRLDKWLFVSRFYKTRSIAAAAIEAGRARVEDERVKPSHPVKAGARITLRKETLVWKLEVVAISDKRGSASEATRLYREAPEDTARREEEISRRKAYAASAPRTPGRPTKRDRRKLHSFLEKA